MTQDSASTRKTAPSSVSVSVSRSFTWGRRDIGACLVLAGLAVALLAPVVFEAALLLPLDLRDRWEPWRTELKPKIGTPHNPLLGDALWEAYPMAVQSQHLWRSGTPLWDPTATIGMPALAAGKMYTNPVYLALATSMSPERAMSWAAVLHLLIALIGMYLLLREIGTRIAPAMLGACAFAFNGYLLVWLSLTYFVGTMVWTPLLFWGIERALRRRDLRWLCVAGIVFAAQILAGFVLFAAHAGLVVTLVYGLRAAARAWRKRSIAAGVRPALLGATALAIGVALAAFQFLPTIELFQQSGRSDQQFGEVLSTRAMIRLLAPGVAGTPLDGEPYNGAINYTETTLYFGVTPLLCLLAALLGARGPRRRLALVFFGVGLAYWLAVFGVAPFHGLARTITPGFQSTFAGRVFFIVAFAWSIAAGLGADALLRARPTRNRGWWSALAVAGLSWMALHHSNAWWIAEYPPLLDTTSVDVATLFLLGCIVLVLMLRVSAIPRAAVGLALVALTAGDLLLTHWAWNTATPASVVFPSTINLDRLTHHGNPDAPPRPNRIATLHGSHMLPGMSAQAFGLSNVSGYSSWIMDRYSRYFTLTGERAKPYSVNRVTLGQCCGPLLDALAAKWVYATHRIPRLDLDGLLIDQLDAVVQSGKPLVYAERRRLNGRPRRSMVVSSASRISFPVDPTSTQRLTAAIGLDPRHCSASDGVRFRVRVHTRAGQISTRFDRMITQRGSADPAWLDIDVPLRDDPNQRLTQITLVTLPSQPGDGSCEHVLWAEPRLHHQPERTTEYRRVSRHRNPIYRNLEALPRARLVHDAIEVPLGDLDAAARVLQDPSFDIRRSAVVEGTLERPLGPASDTDAAKITAFSAHRIEIEVQTEHPALLVLAEGYHRGWRARVDGAATPLLATNLTLRGIPVSAGAHHVTVYFRPTSFLVGGTISVATLATLIVFLIRCRRRSRQD